MEYVVVPFSEYVATIDSHDKILSLGGQCWLMRKDGKRCPSYKIPKEIEQEVMTLLKPAKPAQALDSVRVQKYMRGMVFWADNMTITSQLNETLIALGCYFNGALTRDKKKCPGYVFPRECDWKIFSFIEAVNQYS